jgi:murein DD-endopeptidase MepM/ murein hydrolase activator NlpD
VALAAGFALASGGSAGGAVSAPSTKPALADLLQSVASAEQDATTWRSDASEHPFGVTPAGFVLPVQKFRISSFFMNTDPVHTGGVHSGVDFATESGARIVSICNGKVVAAEYMGAAGNAAIVKAKDGNRVLYGHMSATTVHKGDEIRSGAQIGLVGTTGNSTGPHLHLQVNDPKGKLIDPVTYMGLRHIEVAGYGKR